LAAIMNSSISLWLSRRWRRSMRRPGALVEDDAALGQVEMERAALGARLAERRKGTVKRRHDRLEERLRRCVRRAVARRLRSAS